MKQNCRLFNTTWLQASAVVQTRPSLFWDLTQWRLALSYRRFGTTYRSHLQGPIIPWRTL